MADDLSRPLDIDALSTGVRWRWGIVCIGTILLTVGQSLGFSALSVWFVVSFAAVGSFANLVLIRVLQSGWYRPWLIFGHCAIDLFLVGLAIVVLGPGGAIAGLFLVIIPCTFRERRTLGVFALVAASVTLVSAVIVHNHLAGPDLGTTEPLARAILDLAFFVSVAATLLTTHTNLFARIAGLRQAINEATSGSFNAEPVKPREDHIGFVEHSLTDLLQRMGSTLESVQREIEEIRFLSRTFAHSTSAALESSRRVAAVTARLSSDLKTLESTAVGGIETCADAIRSTQDLNNGAAESAAKLRELEESAERGRKSIAGTIETLLAIGQDIEKTGGIVEELSGLSRQTGSSAITIAKIARHTHILALNAAIEAARAEEHGEEFAVVADQVRTLAGDAGRSARDVGDLVGEINAGITAAASAMVAGGERVTEVCQIAGEARIALASIQTGSSSATQFVAATTAACKSQSSNARSFTDVLTQFQDTMSRWVAEVQTTSQDVSEQMSMIDELTQTSEQLTRAVESLKREAAGFTNAKL